MSRHTTIAVTLIIGILSFPLDASADLTDLHLSVIPRTEAEKERIAAVIQPTDDFSKPEQFESNPAGAATVRVIDSRNAFSQPSGNISFEKELEFKVGNGLFKKLWVSSPSSTLASDGLGPLFPAQLLLY